MTTEERMAAIAARIEDRTSLADVGQSETDSRRRFGSQMKKFAESATLAKADGVAGYDLVILDIEEALSLILGADDEWLAAIDSARQEIEADGRIGDSQIELKRLAYGRGRTRSVVRRLHKDLTLRPEQLLTGWRGAPGSIN